MTAECIMIWETGYTHMFRFAQGTKVSLADVVGDANLMTVPTPASDLILIHFKGILHQQIFYRLNLLFWIVMGCGIAPFGRKGLKTTET